MSYQVLARKWRPKNFHELVGQDHVRKALVSALDNNRLHHAYLFTGTRGVGKTTIARIISKCLNCETGITSRPCGECSSCREIDEGRFVDLIEVDAASRTKVEDTRELLDNVQYAPSRGRFKVYLIDEVHMLSTHSFNALLKTLEEPPPHVKFLLATTDPQKLPVTVLSRCLQFNLKNMPPERVVEHLSNVLTQEQIPFDEPALWQLGRAADGSMRDALSLTDQAIAYGEGEITASQISEMLGLVDHRHVAELIEHLINKDPASMLSEVAKLSEQAADFETILGDMALYLHRMAVGQLLPDAVDNAQGDREQVMNHASRMTAEDLQLYYQIAIKSQDDLPLAPDMRTGFEMAMIRMLAFAPQGVPVANAAPMASNIPAGHSPASAISASLDDGKKKAPVAPSVSSPNSAVSPRSAINTASENTNAAVTNVVSANTIGASPPSERVSPLQALTNPQIAPTNSPQMQSAAQPESGSPSSEQQMSPLQAHNAMLEAHAASQSAGPAVTVDVPPWEELPVMPEPTDSPQIATAPTGTAEAPIAVMPVVEAPVDTPVPYEPQAPVAQPSYESESPAPFDQQLPAAVQVEPVVQNEQPPMWGESQPPVAPQGQFEAQPQAVPQGSFEPQQPFAPQPQVPQQLTDAPGQFTPEPAAEYQQLMPEPSIPVQMAPAPISSPSVPAEQPITASDVLASAPSAVPPTVLGSDPDEIADTGITPLIGPCPGQLQDNNDWLKAFGHLKVNGLERTLAQNAALTRRDGDTLYFDAQLVGPEFATPERIAVWQTAVQQLFNQPVRIEIRQASTHIETPALREEQLKALRKHQAQQIFVQDDHVQRLVTEFGAQVNLDSVEALI
jgi:DNA polymerase-3 subunit gamma/tau